MFKRLKSLFNSGSSSESSSSKLASADVPAPSVKIPAQNVVASAQSSQPTINVAEQPKQTLQTNDNLEYGDYPISDQQLISLEQSEAKADLFVLAYQRYLINRNKSDKAREQINKMIQLTTFDVRAALICQCYYLDNPQKPAGLQDLKYFSPHSITKGLAWFEQQSERAPQLLRQSAIFYLNGVGVTEDIPKAIALLQQGFVQDQCLCSGVLGWIYRNEEKFRDLDLAIQWLTRAADQQDNDSMFELGDIYENEQSVKNLELSMLWYGKGAQTNHAGAMYNLAWAYRHNKSYRDLKLAVKWWTRAAELDDCESMFELGKVYDYEDSVKNLELSMQWYKKASQAGHESAMYNLAWGYRHEKNYRDLKRAIEWWTKAAELGNKSSMFELGKVYAFEDSVKSLDLSMQWFKKAAQAGHVDAMYQLARGYRNEKSYRDLLLAIEWCTKAADLGNNNAMNGLGGIYQEDSVKNIELSIHWYRKGAQAGHKGAMYNLARTYLYQKSYRDVNLAINWYSKAADLGYNPALRSLGYVYRDEAQCLDLKKSEHWFLKAAAVNDIVAMEALGWMYRYEKTMKNKESAYTWYLAAANLGCSRSMSELAEIYLESGSYFNKTESFNWFKRSVEGNGVHELYAFAKASFHAKLFNTSRAMKFGIAAAEQGHIVAISKILNQYSHDNYTGPERNGWIATLKLASDQGYGRASAMLGSYYFFLDRPSSDRYNRISEKQEKQRILLPESLISQHQTNSNSASTSTANSNATEQTSTNVPTKKVVDLDTQSLLKELDGFMGIEAVRQEVASLAAMQKANKLRQQKGLAINTPRLNLIFAGNPGTGKTTVARKLGVIYQRLGLIANSKVVEVSNKDFFGNYDKGGWSEDNFKSVIEKSRGGILFIDEAYQLLSRGEGGQNIINLLLQTMENERDNLMVIVAGYPAEMTTFIESNVGLGSRFNKKILFEDFTPKELLQLFIVNAEKRGSLLNVQAKDALSAYLNRMHESRDKHFGNARFIENLLESIQQQTDLRAISTGEDIGRIKAVDILAVTNDANSEPSPVNKQGLDPEQELFAMTGLKAVKQSVKKLNARIINNKRRQERSLEVQDSGNLHMVFSGNPGTGKTQVARLLAKILKQKGVISHDQVVEVSRQDLVAGYVGQTATKTQKVIDRAMGGVLFIDEAYTLSKKDSDNDFGQEAIDVLLKEMEDKRDQFVVIVAGYEQEMVSFLESNEGLKRRFKQYLRFEDFSPEELVEILEGFSTRGGDYIETNFLSELPLLMAQWREDYGSGFGNAGAVRNLYEAMTESRSLRLMDIDDPSDEQLVRLERADWDDAITELTPI
ncbi:MAG: SEL1-like repeat protein [Gammaproteobacteria bacterium]|nr:SEL1-like repeat protein [Gammaproteobacteria bacterium]